MLEMMLISIRNIFEPWNIFIAFIFSFILYMNLRSKEGDDELTFPGPKRYFGLGCLLTYARFLYDGIPEASSWYLKKYGDTVKVWVFGEPTIISCNPTVARHIFKTNGWNYTSRLGYDEGLRHIGMHNNGIIWNNKTALWKTLRLFFQNALNAKTLSNAVQATVKATERIVDKFDELRKRTADGRIETLNVVRRITLQVTNLLMFGVEIEDDEQLVNLIVEYFAAWEYFLIRPSFLYLIGGKYDKHVSAVKGLLQACQEIVEQKKKQLKLVPFEHLENPNFLECLVNAFHKDEISEENVQQCVLEMLLAGTDTSSVSLYYTLVALCDARDMEAKIIEEIEEHLPNETSLIDRKNLSLLGNLDNALKEGMRIKPVGPVVLRRALKDDVINGVPIKAGTNIILSLIEMHKRDDLFDQPTRFNPNRFKKSQLQNPDYFFPFGTGPKGCVGQFLAMVEMKTAAALLLRDFRFSSAVGKLTEVETRWDIANQPTEPSFMFIEPRQIEEG